MKDKTAAILTIRKAGAMTPKGRRQIAAWLRSHAAYITKYGRAYADGFRGRYIYK